MAFVLRLKTQCREKVGLAGCRVSHWGRSSLRLEGSWVLLCPPDPPTSPSWDKPVPAELKLEAELHGQDLLS